MNKLMLLGGAALLVLSGAAVAQDAGSVPPPDGSATMPAPTPADAPTPPPTADAGTPAAATDAAATPPAAEAATPAPAPGAAASAPVADAAAAASSSTAPATATANPDAVAKVNADWTKYDEGNKGKLTPLEFGTWVMAARGQDVTAQVEKTKTSKRANLPAVKVLNATAGDFAKADTDKDRMVSPNELAVFLSA